MYAVIETGGKQYRVEVGTELEVELLEVAPGDAITLDRVLLVADGDDAQIGRPIVPNATVAAEVLRQIRGEKTISFKYRPKARRRVKKGHRQELTVLRISDIVVGGRSAAADVAQAVEAKRTERQRLEDVARQQAQADAALAAKLAAASKPTAESKGTDAAKPAKPAKKAATVTGAVAEATSDRAAAKTAKSGTAKAPTASKPAADKPKRARATKKDE